MVGTTENEINVACNGTFGKTWDLKPRMVHWIYTMVVRLMLTNDSTVWWPKVRYNVNKDDPNSYNGGPTGTSSSSCYNWG
jgi:hypothetical protein